MSWDTEHTALLEWVLTAATQRGAGASTSVAGSRSI